MLLLSRTLVLAVALKGCHGFSVQVSKPSPPPVADVDRQQAALREQASQVWTTVATADPSERRKEVLVAEKGEIPEDLVGTYYVNGWGSCEVFDRLVHPFESHGFFKAFHFPGGPTVEEVDTAASGQETVLRLDAKYVDTPVRKLENRFRRPLFRGAMSSVADNRSLLGQMMNALSPTEREMANLAVQSWGDKLLITADNCPFFSVDPETLETIGVETFNGALDGHKMMAHTRVDQKRHRLVASALEYDVNNQATKLTFFEFDKNGNLVSQTCHTQSPAIVYHDWMITDHYYVVPAATAVFDMNSLMELILGKIPAIKVFAIDGSAPGSVLLIPRDPNHPVHGGKAIEAKMTDGQHGVVFHLGPCSETDDGKVVMYTMSFGRYQFGDEMGFQLDEQRFDPTTWSVSNGGPMLEEWTVTLPETSGTADEGATRTAHMVGKQLHSVPSDMPTFHPDREGLPCRYLYTVCGVREEGFFPWNAIAKHDLRTGKMQLWPREAAQAMRNDKKGWDGGTCVWSEPLFVPRQSDDDATAKNKRLPREDDGYVLSTCHDAANQHTALHIFDARRLDRGPVAEISLGELWGWNVHGSFVRDD